MTTRPPWLDVLESLLGQPDGPGAELVVTDTAGGDVVYRAPLARHWRLDDSPDGPTLWLRPITGGYQPPDRGPGDPDYYFSLDTARRRGLDIATVETHPGPAPRLDLALRTGQHAAITLAGEDLRPELARWDTWVSLVLPASAEADLEALTDDSWHGPYS